MKSLIVRLFAVAALAVLGLSGMLASSHPSRAESISGTPYRIVGYYGDWDRYGCPSNGSTELTGHCSPVSNVQFSHITDLIYSFADPGPGTQTVANGGQGSNNSSNDSCNLKDFYNDNRDDFGYIRRMKERYPNLQVLLSVGGFSYASDFTNAITSQADINTLVSNCMNLIMLQAPGVFDGIDLDWEWPQNTTQEGELTNLVTSFRSALGNNRVLTMAASANPSSMQYVNWGAVVPNLDWINLETYDYHGPWAPGTRPDRMPIPTSSPRCSRIRRITIRRRAFGARMQSRRSRTLTRCPVQSSCLGFRCMVAATPVRLPVPPATG